ncbi:MAG: hypothetical protein AAF770_01115 [Bacteroidota bacterium]
MYRSSFGKKSSIPVKDKIEQSVNSWITNAEDLFQDTPENNSKNENRINELLLEAPLLENWIKQHISQPSFPKYYLLLFRLHKLKSDNFKSSMRDKMGKLTSKETLTYYQKMIHMLEQAREAYEEFISYQFADISEEDHQREKAIRNEVSYDNQLNMQKVYEELFCCYKMKGLVLYQANKYSAGLTSFEKAKELVKMVEDHALAVTRVAQQSGHEHYLIPTRNVYEDVDSMLTEIKDHLNKRGEEVGGEHNQTESNNKWTIPNHAWVFGAGLILLIAIYILYQKWSNKKQSQTNHSSKKNVILTNRTNYDRVALK